MPLPPVTGATPVITTGTTPTGSHSRSTGRIFIGSGSIGAGFPGLLSDLDATFPSNCRGHHVRAGPCWRALGSQIQFWKIIRWLNVAIDVPTDATVIGSIAAKPAPASATNAHSSQRGVLPRLKT